MEHNYIKLDGQQDLQQLVLFQKDNNIDGKDNLDIIPGQPAVYAVCGRVNGEPANPRFVGATSNLQESVRDHFSGLSPQGQECFGVFMQSIKTKTLVYRLMPSSSEEERAEMRRKWEQQFKPECNDALNEIH